MKYTTTRTIRYHVFVAIVLLIAAMLSMGASATPDAYAAEASSDDSLTVGGATICPVVVSQECARINVWENDVALYDLNGSEGMLSQAYEGKRYLVIVGRYTCGNTRSAVSQAKSLLSESAYQDIDFLVFDVDNDYDSFKDFATYQSDRLHFFSGADYSSWAFNLYGYTSVTLPFLFAVDADGSVLMMGTGNHVVEDFLNEAYGIQPPVGDDGGDADADEDPIVVSPNVTARTQEQIIARMAKDDVMLGVEDKYATKPVFNTTPGELSDETKTLGLGMLNTIRYVAGLDDVVLDDAYGKKAQAAAFVNEAINALTHYPANAAPKPSGMPDDVWELGCEGAACSNLAWDSSVPNLSWTMVHGWMSDADGSNVNKVGHRRWCLNPAMKATGFGGTEYCHAMYSVDESARGSQTNVVWPAQNMPYELFSTGDPWSISVGEAIMKPDKVKVTLTRKSDAKVWTFDQLSTTPPTSGSQKCFFIEDGLDASYMGQPGCIIFRPDGASCKAGDEYHVEAANVNGTTIVYDVKFFEGFAGYHATDPVSSEQLAPVAKPAKKAQAITVKAANAKGVIAKTYGAKAFSLGAKASGNGKLTYSSNNKKVATVSTGGTVTIKGAGTAKITVKAAATATYKAASKTVTITVKRAANPFKIAKATRTLKYSQLKKANKAVAGAKVAKKPAGKAAYAIAKAVKGKKSFKSRFAISKTTGKITVKKGTAKGTYKVTVKATAAGSANYAKSAAKTAVVTITVK